MAEAVHAVVGGQDGKKGSFSAERCDALLRSAPGSRALEAAIEVCPSEVFAGLFAGYLRPRLRRLAANEDGDFGCFIAQRVADGLRDEPQLTLALGEVDFAVCLSPDASPSQQAIVVKFAEACLRLRAGLKLCAAAIFKALKLQETTEHGRSWLTLLLLGKAEAPSDLLRSAGLRGKEEADATSDVGTRILRTLPIAGPQILGTLLRFPSDAVPPLNAGLVKLLGHADSRELLGALARDPKAARVVEAALAPSSALLPKLRKKLARSFKGLLGGLGPHHIGGWVVAAAWRASLGDSATREAFAAELLAVEESLRAHNFAVWKVCGLHQAKSHSEEWAGRQQKASKTQKMFDAILEGGNPEAAKAAAAARQRAAEEAAEREAEMLADPLLAGLLPQAESPEKQDRPPKGKRHRNDEDEREAECTDTEPCDVELDAVFSAKRRTPKQAAKARRLKREATKQAAQAMEPGPRQSDEDLKSVLELISGKALKTKKKKGKKSVAARVCPSADDSE